ncbi:MAG: CvpA family protein [Exilibacterium sp.]
MNWADWTIVAILAVSSLISLKRGFVREALSLANWGIAFVVAMTFREALAQLLAHYIDTPSVREMLAFAILFAATLIVGAMVNHLISEVVRMTGLSGTDRLFGMIFGMARGVIVVLAIILLLPPLVPIDQDSWWQHSVLIPQFLLLEDWSRETVTDLSALVSSWFN